MPFSKTSKALTIGIVAGFGLGLFVREIIAVAEVYAYDNSVAAVKEGMSLAAVEALLERKGSLRRDFDPVPACPSAQTQYVFQDPRSPWLLRFEGHFLVYFDPSERVCATQRFRL